jgi:Mg2+ and Co2+ transporter CorA
VQIIEFGAGTLRFLESVPHRAPEGGFVWIYLEREQLEADLPLLQRAAHVLGGSQMLDVHLKDLGNRSHPSNYDYTSIYDLVVFRRLATEAEVRAEVGERNLAPKAHPLGAFSRIRTRAVGFVVFDRLLITVHPDSCFTARVFIERYLSDAVQAEGLTAAARSRLPVSAADLMVRMLNLMGDSYLELRKDLSTDLDQWQQGLLARARDVVEHIQRVVHHVRRMEEGAETAVQIHFSAVGHRTNEIMRTLTALTAIFLPLNLIVGFFGMNFEFMPAIHAQDGFWWTVVLMALIALAMGVVFWRKRYLARTGR